MGKLVHILCAVSIFNAAALAYPSRESTESKETNEEPTTPTQIIRGQGYPAEEHTVTTYDGYILTMHRIPHGKRSNCANEFTPSRECSNKPVVFLQHGLVSSSAAFLIAGAERSIAFILADAGYDVWLGNFRGNTYSRQHSSMDPDQDKDYWKFSWHEQGTIDLPKMIDYVLATTEQEKLHFIGHSQGSTTFLVMTTSMPQYNAKIRGAHLMSPVAFVQNIRSEIVRFLSRQMGNGERWIGTTEFEPSNEFFRDAGEAMCRTKAMDRNVCANAMFMLAGYDSAHLNATLLPEIMMRYPAGSSARQLMHYAQEVRSGKFCEYDHGMAGNMMKYGVAKPRSYKLADVRAPVSLYYSHNDWFATPQDVDTLREKLPNVKMDYVVPDQRWNHIDFLWASDARSVVYNKIMESMRQN